MKGLKHGGVLCEDTGHLVENEDCGELRRIRTRIGQKKILESGYASMSECKEHWPGMLIDLDLNPEPTTLG